MKPRLITVGRLMREFDLPWQSAEAIVRTQTEQMRKRAWPAEVCRAAGLLLSVVGVPWLVPEGHRGLAILLRLPALLLLVVGILLPQWLAREAILTAAREAAPTHRQPASVVRR